MPDSDGFGFRPRKLGYVIVGIVLLYIGFTTVRNNRIDALAHVAMSDQSDPQIVNKLASYRGTRSAELLLTVASAAPEQQNRIAAIHALVERKDAAMVARLSELLLPQQPLAIRVEIARALYATGCPPECVKNVLYFEERMTNGARPSEDVSAEPPRSLSQPERELQNMLDEVIKKNKAALGLVLSKVYGLNTNFPSSLAIDLVERLNIKEACPALVHTFLSVDDQVRNSPEYQEVSQAVKILDCSTFAMTY
jgi:hypothetical protein